MLKTCEVIYGCNRGAQICATIEGAMSQPCPCKVGQPCPLMPKDAAASVLELDDLALH